VHWDKRPPDADYVILADPEGNRFCVVDAGQVAALNAESRVSPTPSSSTAGQSAFEASERFLLSRGDQL